MKDYESKRFLKSGKNCGRGSLSKLTYLFYKKYKL